MDKMRKNKGITLIALIITIVILLILAVVTIRSVTGDGIIGKAQQAKESYQTSQEDEKTALGNYLTTIEGIAGGTNPNISSYTKDGVPIPRGFYYVGGTKNTGVVISSVEGDDMHNTKKGNQFVWVPVNQTINPEGYGLGTEGHGEPDVVTCDNDSTYLNIVNNILGTTYKTSDDFLIDLKTDYKAMAESVNVNNGFYVGRYETSVANGVAKSVKGVESATAEDYLNGTDGQQYTWYGLYAYEKAAYNSDSYSVQSTMIWGSQYDTMMIWMRNTDKDVDSPIEGYNQSKITGSEEYPDDKINNVYDLYGNSFEWTLEAEYTFYRVYRGDCFESGQYAPSHRSDDGPSSINYPNGSRLALYIK